MATSSVLPQKHATEIVGRLFVAISFLLLGWFWMYSFLSDLPVIQRNIQVEDVLQQTLGRKQGAPAYEQGILWLQRFLGIYGNVIVKLVSGPTMLLCAHVWMWHVFSSDTRSPWSSLFFSGPTLDAADVSLFPSSPPFTLSLLIWDALFFLFFSHLLAFLAATNAVLGPLGCHWPPFIAVLHRLLSL